MTALQQFIVSAPTHCPWMADIVLPYSKSLYNRALVVNALAWTEQGRLSSEWPMRHEVHSGNVKPQSERYCDDTRVMLQWLLQAHERRGGVIDIGAAGTAMRFSAAMLTLLEGEWTLTGTARMKERPIGVLVEALRSLGAQIDYIEREGFPPLRIVGGTATGSRTHRVCLSGSVSSQYISALLMIGPLLPEGLTLQLEGDIVSRPYIDMTLHQMCWNGADARWTNERTLRVEPVPYERKTYLSVENDWTAASYWYEVVALSPDKDTAVQLSNLHVGSRQGDSRVEKIFELLGVETLHLQDDLNHVQLRATGRVCERLDWDFVETPDLAQTVAVTCCMLGVPFHFTGLQSLKIKETDRIVALQNELAKLSFTVRATEREMWWEGPAADPAVAPFTENAAAVPYVATESKHPGPIATYKDHRMAMAFAPSALRLGSIVINDPTVVAKSYPGFWNDMKKFGFGIEEQTETTGKP